MDPSKEFDSVGKNESKLATVKWIVQDRINKYGENLTLACTAEEMPPHMTLSWHTEQEVCAIDNISGNSAKYVPYIVPSKGGYLTILNFGREDINKSYRCTIEFQKLEKVLTAADVFNDSQDNVLKSVDGEAESIWTNLTIIVYIAAIALIIFMVGAILCPWKKREQIFQHFKRGQPSDRYTDTDIGEIARWLHDKEKT